VRALSTASTVPLAAGSLIAAYGVVAASGSRPLGGLVLLLGGAVCLWIWRRRHGGRMALELGGALFGAFVLSHLLALAIGAWAAVIVCAALAGAFIAVRAERAQAPLPERS